MENIEVYDTILIGKNPSIFMSSIYIQTYNMKQLLISEESKESLNFEGHEYVPGVLEVKSKEDLLSILEEQVRNLGCPVLNEKVVDIKFDKIFQIKCTKSTFYCKSIVVDDKQMEIGNPGCFNSLKNVKTKEAIEMLSNGCKVSFAVREYVNGL
jgi:thioredoxin reductase